MSDYHSEYEPDNPTGMSGKDKMHEQYLHCLEDCDKCTEIQILKKILYELRKLNRKMREAR